MNTIILKGKLSNIQFSHFIGDIEYNKANLIVDRKNGEEDVIELKFKKFSNPYKEGQEISTIGNVRSYTRKENEVGNRVNIYVFTYFDLPGLDDNDQEIINKFIIDGRICKKLDDGVRELPNGKQNYHFILANNMIVEDKKQKLNSYLPCIAWGKIAKELSQLKVNDKIEIYGELHSRQYTKTLPDGEQQIRTAHECVITSYTIIGEDE